MVETYYANIVIFRVGLKIGTNEDTQKNGFYFLKILGLIYLLMKPAYLRANSIPFLQIKLPKEVKEA